LFVFCLFVQAKCVEKLGRIMSPFMPDIMKELPKASKSTEVQVSGLTRAMLGGGN
jgi:spore maturation protein SpmA